jgi:hypothetical protein
VTSSIIRRNMQREHVKKLSNLVLGPKTSYSVYYYYFEDDYGGSAPPDARSLARMHLREIHKRIQATLDDRQAAVDETTRAHLEESSERISKVLSASMQIND